MSYWNDKVVVITGGSSGLGLEFARALVAQKAKVAIVARDDTRINEALEKLACPALFITGSQEPNSTPDMSLKMAEITPNGRALIIDGAAHMMPMTHASQVNAAISSFQSEVQS